MDVSESDCGNHDGDDPCSNDNCHEYYDDNFVIDRE
jgi:hypothetical protein